MISSITGIIKELNNQQVIIDIGPIECTLSVPNSALYALQKSVTLSVYMHWNSEQGPSFYGFTSPFEKKIFALIISCPGIGPKIALAALADLGAILFLETVQLNDIKKMSSINGVGTKKAEQIIMHLKNKIAGLYAAEKSTTQSKKCEQWQTIHLTLESLNYSRFEIAQAMDHLKTTSAQTEHSFDQSLRIALTFLAKRSLLLKQ